MPAEVTALFQVPDYLVLVVLVGLAGVRLEFQVLRSMGVKGATAGKRKAASWITVLVLACTPLPVLRRIALVVLIGALLQGVAYVVVMATGWGRRQVLAKRMRARLHLLQRTAPSPLPPSQVPWELKTWAKELRQSGFVPVSADRRSDEVTMVTLLRPADSVIAVLFWQLNRLAFLPLPFTQLISVPVGRAGALSTSNGPGPDAISWLIPQIIRVGTLRGLLAKHEEAYRLLEWRGVRFDAVEAEEVVGITERLWSETLSALVALPTESLLFLRRRLRRPTLTLASMIDHPEIVDRIERFRVGATGAAASGPGML